METPTPSPAESPESPRFGPHSFPITLDTHNSQWPFGAVYSPLDSPFGCRGSEISPDQVDRILKQIEPERSEIGVLEVIICLGGAAVLIGMIVLFLAAARS